MRKESFVVDDFVHVLRRGTRSLPIVHDNRDKQRFLKLLYYFNDTYTPQYWEQEITTNGHNDPPVFYRPSKWKEREPLVMVVSYCLIPNHFHLLLKEIIEGGISLFMQKIGNSMVGHYNQKYRAVGSLFQGSYKGKRIDSDEYLRYVAVYIMVKNSLEMYPGGIKKAYREFDKAFEWAEKNPYTSLGHYTGVLKTNIIEANLLGEIFENRRELKEFSKDVICGRLEKEFDNLHLE
ncbi:MAG: hypothetical protein HYV67_01605 [Candidatus Taylorbacteria bacterium]|nr:hypothetical protein [Candidatus Taylorbacteria bacterium]